MPRSPRSRIGDLEIDQDMEVQRRSWRFQRIGWGGIVLFLGAALAGLFGDGPLSRDRVGDPAHLEVAYPRFERRSQEAVLIVRFGPQPSGVVRLWIDRDYLSEQPIQRVEPVPERAEAHSDRLILDVRVSGDSPEVRITTMPVGFGPLRGRLGLLGGPEVSFEQFVYP